MRWCAHCVPSVCERQNLAGDWGEGDYGEDVGAVKTEVVIPVEHLREPYRVSKDSSDCISIAGEQAHAARGNGQEDVAVPLRHAVFHPPVRVVRHQPDVVLPCGRTGAADEGVNLGLCEEEDNDWCIDLEGVNEVVKAG